MCQERRQGPPDGPSPHPCRPEAEPETDTVPEAEADEDPLAGADSAAEGYSAHRRAVDEDLAAGVDPEGEDDVDLDDRWFGLDQALRDPFSPVTGPVCDPESTGVATGPSRSTARENLDAQLVHGPDSRRLSLDGMWRAVGSPAGKGALGWIALARPMVPAFKRYLGNLAACGFHYEFGYGQLLFIEEEEDIDDDHRAGDLTTPLWLIAEAYASFLDSVTSSGE